MLLIALIVVGGRRVRHLGFMEADPIVERFCGLKRMPSVRTLNRWLSSVDERTVEGLQSLNDEVVSKRIDDAGLRRLTIDVDGSVVETGRKVEGARRGYSPLRRRKPSYYPITAYEAQTGQIIGVQNRPGNIHDGKASLEFLEGLIKTLRTRYGSGLKLEFRMDAAFFLRSVLDLLDREHAEYALKVPFWHWLGIKAKVEARKRWKRLDAEHEYFETELTAAAWDRRFRAIILRKRVFHKTPRNYQLDLFDPSDGYYEYSAMVTNKTLGARALRDFMNGRGSHEKAYGELKSSFAFSNQPSQRCAANSAWQVLSVVSFNLTRAFQAASLAEPRFSNAKRRTRHLFSSINTLRYELLHRAGLLTAPKGRATLDVGPSPAVEERFSRAREKLRKAA